MNNTDNQLGDFFNRINSIQRLLICFGFGISIFLLSGLSSHIDILTRVLGGWDVFALSMIGMSWAIFYATESREIREEVKAQDASRAVSFVIVLVAAVCSLLAVLILLTDKERGMSKILQTSVAILGMALSWFLVHTLFAFRYGHLYYGDHPDNPEIHAEGLVFPGKDHPDYLDFAYFSFIIGMTFQVSDVNITSRLIRRVVLFHGLISFAFNTIIFALSINVIAGLFH